MSLSDLIPTLQLAIGPVILISGIGLLLLSMTNRMGRVIDRSHVLIQDYGPAIEGARDIVGAQLAILVRRARIIRVAIALSALSVLLAAVLVISLFVGALLQLEIAILLVGIFVLCLICLIVSLIFFITDINLSLKALWLEIPAED